MKSGVRIRLPKGTSLWDTVCQEGLEGEVTAALVNNKTSDLRVILDEDSTVELLTVHSVEGMRVYRNSLVLLMLRAAKEIMPGARIHIEHSLSNGLFGEIECPDRPLGQRDIECIETRMRELVAEDIPFRSEQMPVNKARNLFSRQNLLDKVRLLEYAPDDFVRVCRCGWYQDTLADVTVPSTKYLSVFRLRFYLPGFILEYPQHQEPTKIPEYVEQGKLATVYYHSEKWSQLLEIGDIPALNKTIESGQSGSLIRIAEAHQEKQVAAIADQIARERDRLRLILIAGPSSSGKTTFAHRLAVQLQVNGLRPVAISLDDYFHDREHTPREADGSYDFESLEAIDVELFNDHLSQLIQGESVELPTFSFLDGQRQWNGRTLQVHPDQPMIIEGIHGLNDRLTNAIPQGRKFKVYVSALTTLNLDDHTRIPTTDARLIRRIVRDAEFRNHSAAETLQRWPSVRRGEERHIFPFQEDADVMLNTALTYELSVLKERAERLLGDITQEQPTYGKAARLLSLLGYVLPLDREELIPCNSIVREFIGGSCFDE